MDDYELLHSLLYLYGYFLRLLYGIRYNIYRYVVLNDPIKKHILRYAVTKIFSKIFCISLH
ncbi:hypothetical protein PGB90_007126 [Kerria lacca]